MKDRFAVCELCGKQFNLNAVINGKPKWFHRSRKRCFDCSPTAEKGKTNNRTSHTLQLELSGNRKCNLCDKVKPITEFNDCKTRREYRCIACMKAKSKELQRRFKQQAVDYKGGSCCKCGYSKCLSALEFHHIDPAKKEYELKTTLNFDSAKPELDKCICLCANCHREVHSDE